MLPHIRPDFGTRRCEYLRKSKAGVGTLGAFAASARLTSRTGSATLASRFSPDKFAELARKDHLVRCFLDGAAKSEFLTSRSSHTLKTQYLLASFRNNLLPLNLPSLMNSNFWRYSLTSPPHLKPIQFRHGNVQLTVKASRGRVTPQILDQGLLATPTNGGRLQREPCVRPGR